MFFLLFSFVKISAGTEQIIHWLTGEIFHYYSSLNKIKLFEQIQLFISKILIRMKIKFASFDTTGECLACLERFFLHTSTNISTSFTTFSLYNILLIQMNACLYFFQVHVSPHFIKE